MNAKVIELSAQLRDELQRTPEPVIIPYGMHHSVPGAVYHQRRLGVVSKSALDLVHRSPAHYKSWVDGVLPDEETPALTFGRAFHCALLEPDVFTKTYAVAPDFGDCRRSANRDARDAWRRENANRELLDHDSVQTITGMVNAVHAHPLGKKMLRHGKAELTISWKDSETGLSCKSRADYYVERLGMIADAKSTLDASWESFRKDIVKHRYHVQDALYRAGFDAVGASVQHFVFIAVEKTPPYAVGIYSLDAEGIGKGYSAARRDIDTLAECVSTGKFPGYPETIRTIDLPPWAE